MGKKINNKIKWMLRTSQGLDEVARYRPVLEDDEFDEIPDFKQPQDGVASPMLGQNDSTVFTEAGEEGNEKEDENPNPETGPKEPVEPSNAPAPAIDDKGDDGFDITQPPPPDDKDTPMGEKPPMDVEKNIDASEEGAEVDTLQNDIMRHNLEAVKAIHDKLKELDNVLDSFNSKVEELNTKVKEVEEPTNVEKLMTKKDVSFPYVFNLNDYWRGNWYEQKYMENSETNKGIKELPDGTYIADFDDLATHNDMDVEDSITNFDKIV